MAKVVLQENRYCAQLRKSIAADAEALWKKANRLENTGVDVKKLEKIKIDLSAVESGIPAIPTHDWNGLCYASMQLGAIGKRLSVLDFFR